MKTKRIKELALLPYVIFVIGVIFLGINGKISGIVFIISSCYLLHGYIKRWKHIYCFYQSNHRSSKMTPHEINWDKYETWEYYWLPCFSGILGVALLLL